MVVVNEIMGRMTAAGAVIQTFSANTKAAFDFITKGQIPKFKSLSKAWEKEIGIMNKTSQMMFEERWASEEKSQTVAEETSAVVEAASNQATDAQTTNAKKVKKANDKAKGSFTGFADAVKSAQRFASEGFAASAKSVAAGTATGGSTNAGEVKISSDSVSALTKDSGTAEQQRKAMIESLGEIVDLTKRSAVFA